MVERLIISIDGDSTGLTKALGSAENRLNSFNQRITNSSRNLTNLQNKMSAFGASMASMTAANNKMAAALTNMAARTNQASVSLQRKSASLRVATRHTQTFTGSLWELTRKLTIVNTLLLAGGGFFGGLIKSTIDANSKIERLNMLLQGIAKAPTEAGKALEAKGNMNFLWDMADKAPFAMDALSESFVKLKANGLDPTNGSLQTLVDSVAKFGGTTENLKSAGLAISQMMSKGVVSMEELRQQLADSGGIPTAIKAMAKGLGYGTNEMQKFYKEVSKGNILASKGIPAMLKVLEEENKGSAEKMMNTWSGQTAKMENAWQKFLVRITTMSGNGSFFQTLKKQIDQFTTFLNSRKGDEFAKDVSEMFARIALTISSTIQWLWKYRDIIKEIAVAFITMWAAKTTMNLFKDFGLAILSTGLKLKQFVGLIPTTISFLSKLGSVSNGVQLMILLFGKNVAVAAKQMGLFNAAGQISLRSLGLLSLRFGLIGAGVAAAGYAFYKYYQYIQTSTKATDQYNKINDNTWKIHDKIKNSLNGVTFANEKERISALNLLQTQRAQIVTTGQLAVTYMRLAQSKLAAAKAELANRNAQAAQTMGVASGLPFGLGALAGFLPGIMNKGARQKVEDQNAELKFATDHVNQIAEDIQAYNGKINDLHFAAPDFSLPPEVTGSSDKNGSSKLSNQIDNMREKWVEAKLKYAQLIEEFNNGNLDNFDTDKMRTQFEEQSKMLKGGVDAIQKSVDDLNDQSKKQKNANSRKSILTEMSADAKTSAKELTNSVADYNRGFKSIESSVDKFRDSLNDKIDWTKLFAGPDAIADAEEAKKLINSLADTERSKLIVDITADYRDKNREILEGMMTQDELNEANYQKEKARIEDIIASLSMQDSNQSILAGNLTTYLENYKKNQKLQSPFGKWAKDASDLKLNIQNSLASSLDGFAEQLASGKLNFKAFAKSIIKDLIAIIIKAMIAKAILSALGLGGPSVDFSNIPDGPALVPVSTNHSGGIAGREATSVKSVDARMFAFAKKYHSGGFPGLRSDEVPIIAKKGEGVFTPEQMKALGNGRSGGSSPPPQVNVINQTSQKVEANDVSSRFDGEKYVLDVVIKHANKPGPMRDMLKGLK